jgi:hypothetical protein
MPTTHAPAATTPAPASTSAAAPTAAPVAATPAEGCGPNPAAAAAAAAASPGPADQTAPHDGDHNQGGARPAGLEYQRELGTEQDA